MKYALTCRDGFVINMDIRDGVNPMEEVQRWATPPDVIKCEQVREFAPLSPPDAAAPVVSGVSDDAIVSIVADLQRRVKLLEGGMGKLAQAVQS